MAAALLSCRALSGIEPVCDGLMERYGTRLTVVANIASLTQSFENGGSQGPPEMRSPLCPVETAVGELPPGFRGVRRINAAALEGLAALWGEAIVWP